MNERELDEGCWVARIELVQGNITQQDTAAIANTANRQALSERHAG